MRKGGTVQRLQEASIHEFDVTVRAGTSGQLESLHSGIKHSVSLENDLKGHRESNQITFI